jgi:heat shock protein HslJ
MLHRPLSLPWLVALALAVPAWAAAAEAASQPTPNRRAADPALVRTLQDHRWTLQSATDAAGQPLPTLTVPGHELAMHFDGPRLSVEGGCNRLNGTWRVSPQGQLMVGRLSSTMMACEAPLMQADAALSALLGQSLAIAVTPGTTPTLRLTAPNSEAVVWSGQPTLQSLYGAPTRIFLEVAAQTVDCKAPQNPGSDCLRVRERFFDKQGLPSPKTGEWTPFPGRIEGYTHTPGVRNVLRVDRYTRKPASAEGPAYVYVLDLTVESETVPQ